MGQYINLGLSCKVIINKNKLPEIIRNKENIIEIMSKEIDVDCYTLTEYDDYYEFKVKDEIFNNKNLKGFLNEQYDLLNVEEKNIILNDIETLDNYDKVRDFFRHKSYPNFQKYNYIGWIYERLYNGQDICLRVNIEGVLYFHEGKAYLECYSDLFKYIKKLIKKNSSYNISKLIHVSLL